MNQTDHALRRLFQAAARARPPEPDPLPPRLEAAILARWRAGDPIPVTDLFRGLFRSGLAWACAVLLASMALTWQDANTEPASMVTLVNDMIQETTTPWAP